MAKLVVFTGAGISADSGISTFRDTDGLWENHSVDAVCDMMTWKRNFDLVHRFYNERRVQLGTVVPNAAHEMVAQWQDRYETTVITQNVDDLFERAGCKDVMHVHGFLTEMKCLACGEVWDIGYREWKPFERCDCGSLKGVKPNVVFFNENAPKYSNMWKVLASLTADDVLLVMGTMGKVIDIGTVASASICHSILSNLQSNTGASMPYAPLVEDRQFTTVIHGRAVETVAQIDAHIASLLSPKNL